MRTCHTLGIVLNVLCDLFLGLFMWTRVHFTPSSSVSPGTLWYRVLCGSIILLVLTPFVLFD